MVNKEKGTTIYKILVFPERLNNSFLILSIILLALIGTTIGFFGLKKGDYLNIPDYDELVYSENLNPHLFILNTYTKSSEDIVQKTQIKIAYTKANEKLNEGIVNNGFVVQENGDIVYFKTQKNPSSTSGTSTYDRIVGPSYKTIKGSTTYESRIKEIYEQVIYNVTDETEKREITFKEKIISLTDAEIKKDIINEFTSDKNLFSSFDIYVNKTSNTDRYYIYNRFDIMASARDKFHLDYQLFAIDEDNNQYELFGFYNISNKNIQYYGSSSHSGEHAELPKSINYEYLMAKAVYIDKDGDQNIFYYKIAFKDLI